MSSDAAAASPEPVQAVPVANDAWYLHSQGRQFGPLTEDEMCGYFRAGMVKAGDEIAVPLQFGTVPATTAATMLGVAAPSPSEAGPVLVTSYFMPPAERQGLSPVYVLGAIVAVIGLVYLSVHRPALRISPVADISPAVVTVPSQAQSTGTHAVEPPRAAEAQPQPVAPATTEPTQEVAPLIVDVAPTATVSSTSSGADAWSLEAHRLNEVGDWAGLKIHAEKWATVQPDRELPWWYLGGAQARLGQYPASIDAYKHVLALSPNHFRVRWALADLYLRVNQFRDAADILNALTSESPATAGLWNDLGIAMDNLGEYDEAVASFQKAVQLDPDYRQAWANLAQCYAHFGYADKSKAALVQANAR